MDVNTDRRGLLWILEEESMFPGASDGSFLDRVHMYHGKPSEMGRSYQTPDTPGEREGERGRGREGERGRGRGNIVCCSSLKCETQIPFSERMNSSYYDFWVLYTSQELLSHIL